MYGKGMWKTDFSKIGALRRQKGDVERMSQAGLNLAYRFLFAKFFVF